MADVKDAIEEMIEESYLLGFRKRKFSPISAAL